MRSADNISEYVDVGGPYIKTLEKRKVFIVEDNDMHSMMMDYLLSKENSFQIFKFRSGEECIQKLYTIRPDIIILDYGLPGINGMETFEKIKKYDSKIPVVVVTDNKSMQIAQQFIYAGAYDYILKEQNAFNKLNGIVNKVFQAIARREYESADKRTLWLIGGFILLIIASSIISYLAIKH